MKLIFSLITDDLTQSMIVGRVSTHVHRVIVVLLRGVNVGLSRSSEVCKCYAYSTTRLHFLTDFDDPFILLTREIHESRDSGRRLQLGVAARDRQGIIDAAGQAVVVDERARGRGGLVSDGWAQGDADHVGQVGGH